MVTTTRATGSSSSGRKRLRIPARFLHTCARRHRPDGRRLSTVRGERTDGFNPAPFNYSQTPNERTSLWLLGSRPLGESANLFLEGFAHHRESAPEAAPASNFGVDVLPADNYYNPFGVDVPLVGAAWSRPATAGTSRRSICGAR